MNPLPDTIGAALRRSARNHPARIAVVGDGQRLSFRSLDERADHLALGLQALGIGPGDHVALLMTNDPEWVLVWMATLRLGAVLVPVNTRYKREEVEYVLRQSDARLLVTMDRCWDIDYLGLIRDTLAVGQTTGQFRPDLNPTIAAKIFFGALDEMATNWMLSRRRYSLPAQADTIVDLFINGVGPRPSTPAPSPRMARTNIQGGVPNGRALRIGAP